MNAELTHELGFENDKAAVKGIAITGDRISVNRSSQHSEIELDIPA